VLFTAPTVLCVIYTRKENSMATKSKTPATATPLDDLVVYATVETHIDVYEEAPATPYIARIQGEGDLDGATVNLASASVFVWDGCYHEDAVAMHIAFDSLSSDLEEVSAAILQHIDELSDDYAGSVMIIDDVKVLESYKSEKSLAPRAVAAALVAAGVLRNECLIAGIAWDTSRANVYKALGMAKVKGTKLYVGHNATIGINDSVRNALSY
jgi:hypothetical protein